MTTKGSEWYNECQRMTASGITSENKWKQAAMNGNEWQQVTTTVMATSVTEWNTAMLGFKVKQNVSLFTEEVCSIFYTMYNYIIFSNIDYL